MSQKYQDRHATLASLRHARAAQRKQQQDDLSAHRQAVSATASAARAERQAALSDVQNDRLDGRGARAKMRKTVEAALKADHAQRQKNIHGLLKDSAKTRRQDSALGRSERLTHLKTLAKTRGAPVALTQGGRAGSSPKAPTVETGMRESADPVKTETCETPNTEKP